MPLGFDVTSVTSLVSQGISTGGSLAAQKATLSQQTKTEKLRLQSQEAIAEKELAFRQQELLAQQGIAGKRDELFKRLFGISVIGLASLAIVIISGVLLIQKKGRKKQETLVKRKRKKK